MLLERDEAQAIARILAHGYYIKKLPVINKYFRRSRGFFMRFDIFINALQVGIMNSLFEVQQAAMKGKQILENDALDEKDRKGIESQLLMNKHLARVLQTIMDGIAWRNLLYRRPIIRLLSENQSPGYLTEHEVKTYKKVLLKSRQRVIVNDLTHYLRTADLTKIDKSKRIFLIESKKEGKKIQDVGDILDSLKRTKGDVSKQTLRQIVAQMSIIDNKISIPVFSSGCIREIEYEIINVDFPIPTHHARMKRMIRKANRKGYCIERLEEGYLVNVSAYDKMTSEKKKFKKRFEAYKEEYQKKRSECFGEKRKGIIPDSSWDSFLEEGGHFPRNHTPISILPFKNKDCVRLMMGFLKIDVQIDIDVIIAKLRSDGWQVEMNTQIKKQPRIDPNTYEPFSVYQENYFDDSREDFLKLSRTEGNRTLYITIPFTFVLIMMTSFYQMDFLCKEVISHFSDSSRPDSLPRSKRVQVNFLGEREVLK